MKHLRLVVVAAIVVAAVLFALLTNSPSQAPGPKCGVYRNDKTVTIGSVQIKAEIVESPAEREQGLSGRPCIEANQGMLFVFDKPGRYPFWMKDMKFPIDIVWIAASRTVVGLDIDVVPSTYPDAFVSEKPAQYVLELQANRAKDLEISLGTPVNF
ncbi:DUF192 domain-containing protein [Candidatus Saccharibacteria bacterium]|nr:DUF192 domain-containing protein [Candidatus Saccharibacteria bacterium]